MSSRAFSMIFLSATASPTPMFRVILVIFGISIEFSRPSVFLSCGASSSRYCSCKRAILFLLNVDYVAALEYAHLGAVFFDAETNSLTLF